MVNDVPIIDTRSPVIEQELEALYPFARMVSKAAGAADRGATQLRQLRYDESQMQRMES